MPAHADACGDNVSFTGREELMLRCATSAALPLKAYSAACTSLTASHVSSAIRRPDVCCRVVQYYNMISCFKFTHLSEQQGRLEKANIEYVVLAGSSLFLCEWCTLCEMCLHIGRDRIVFVKGKWRSRVSKKLKIFRPRRGGASRPARPRRLEAGAARLWLFTKKHMFFLHLIGARPQAC